MSKTIIIGDVHGCINELNELLEKIKLHPKDQLIYVGDIIHKGPNSRKALNRALFSYGYPYKKPITILGNHEEKHLRWWKNELDGQHSFLNKNPVNIPKKEWFSGISQYHINLIKTFPIYYKGNGFMVVHGGIPSKMKELPPSTLPELNELSSKQRTKALKILRTRFETPEGESVKLGKQTPEDVFWAEKYDGRFGHIYFGHQVFFPEQFPRKFPHATPLDYGCVHGGKLVAAIIKDNKTTLVSVDAKTKYCERKY